VVLGFNISISISISDSFYIAFSREDWEQLVKPARAEEYVNTRHHWLPHHPDADPAAAVFDARTPGLFHVEFTGDCVIALNPKTYYAEGFDPKDTTKRIVKRSTKGCPKKLNDFRKEQFLEVLRTHRSISGEVRSLRYNNQKEMKYGRMDMRRIGLSYLMIKRQVQSDGIHTLPLTLEGRMRSNSDSD
jgi:hypothetical protein